MSSWRRAKRLLEALLFISGEPVDERTIERICGLKGREIERAIDEVNEELEEHPFLIERMGNGWHFVLKAEYANLLPISLGRSLLSKGELRTLALIAANEPLRLSDLTAIRGGSARRHVRKLKSMGLISVSREGRSKILRTTAKFKSLFRLVLEGEGDNRSVPGD